VYLYPSAPPRRYVRRRCSEKWRVSSSRSRSLYTRSVGVSNKPVARVEGAALERDARRDAQPRVQRGAQCTHLLLERVRNHLHAEQERESGVRACDVRALSVRVCGRAAEWCIGGASAVRRWCSAAAI
jgi:hypothetical protein